jgi:hypothetical protein
LKCGIQNNDCNKESKGYRRYKITNEKAAKGTTRNTKTGATTSTTNEKATATGATTAIRNQNAGTAITPPIFPFQ